MDIERILDGLGRLWPALPLAIVGVGLCGAAMAMQWQLRHRDELVQVQARITRSWSEVSGTASPGSSGSRSWWVHALCDYRWAAAPFTGKQIELGGGSVSSQREMEALLADHPAGAQIALWVNPRTPGLPMTDRPEQGKVYVAGGIGAVFLAAAAFFFFFGNR